MRSRFRVVIPAAIVAAISVVAAGAQDEHTELMAREHQGDVPVPSPAASLEPAIAVVAEKVTYAPLGDAAVQGFLARPAAPESTPGPKAGLIVIHEWWGLNSNIESMARRLAGEGYLALAVDLYGGQVASDRDGARALMSAAMANTDPVEENLRQAYAYLKSQGVSKVGSIGWCFGGGWSLQAALLLPGELDAAVIYYGRVVTDRERLAGLTTPILGHFGSEDRGIPIDGVREFEKALADLGKDARIHVYQGADHAFANPSGTRYNAAAAETAWARTLAFFAETLK